MFAVLVALALLIISVCAIYLLLRSMGQDGVEIAAPGSCKSGRCGVRGGTATGTSCHQAEAPLGEPNEIEELPALDRQPADAEQQGSRPG